MLSCGAPLPPPLRIAVGLSGGVDSAVTALVLRRCVHTRRDVAALRRFGRVDTPPPPLSVLHTSVEASTPLTDLLPDAVRRTRAFDVTESRDFQSIEYFPFFMRNWHDHDSPHGWCVRSQRDYDDAQAVAHATALLPCTTALPILDFAEAYAEKCFQRMLNAYAAGHTLNVDVLCNAYIKFGAVAQALKVEQAGSSIFQSTPESDEPVPSQQTLLATGHYARTWPVHLRTTPSTSVIQVQDASSSLPAQLLLQPCSAASDLNDQTHFLSRVSPNALAGALFPLGHLFRCKADVRAVAQRAFAEMPSVAHVAHKQTSTGICFVGPPPKAPASATPAGAATCPPSFLTEGNAGGSGSSAAPLTSPLEVSCKARFANFLNEYLPPPPSPQHQEQQGEALASFAESATCPARTRFRDVDTNEEKILLNEADTFGPLERDYPTLLPAYAVTLGQRLRLINPHPATPTRAGETKRKLDKTHARSFYVARKVLCPRMSSLQGAASQTEVRLLAEVHVVDRWDHPSLFTVDVPVAALRWWLPIAVLECASAVTEREGVRSYITSCLCAVRHQMTPQPALVRWTRKCAVQGKDSAETLEARGGGTSEGNCEVTNLPCVQRCAVTFQDAVRAPAAGQAVVLYAAVSDISAWLQQSMKAEADASAEWTAPLPAGGADLAVIGSGWVAATPEDE